MIGSLALLLAAPALELPRLPEGDCFAADFVQTRSLPMLERPLTLDGRLRIETGGALEWEVTRPYRYRFSVRDGDVTETLPDGTERTIDAAEARWLTGMQQLLGGLLAGRGEALHDWFQVLDDVQGEHGRELVLQPNSTAIAQAVERMTVTYDEQLRGVRIDETSGGITGIRFSTLRICEEAAR